MTEPTPSSKPSVPTSSPVVDWFGRHGIKAIAVLAVIEIAFHAWAVTSAKRREQESSSSTSGAVVPATGVAPAVNGPDTAVSAPTPAPAPH